MATIKIIWDLVQNQLLGMQWLYGIVGHALVKLGLDINGRLGGGIHFFIYDTSYLRCL